MSSSLILGCIWVLAATVTAFLPMRRQYPPGIVLLIAAPFLLVYIGWQHGVWIALLGVLGFVSMFRNPLIYFARRAMGRGAARATNKPVSAPENDAP
ncbi:MAG: DUF2484 family protein [Paracoccaceae bacterium]|nr:DUF2484 family protein [Paracoccaceae bacterium]